MKSSICTDAHAHLQGETATHPTALPCGALAALLVVAGVQPAASSRLASAPHDNTAWRVKLRFLG